MDAVDTILPALAIVDEVCEENGIEPVSAALTDPGAVPLSELVDQRSPQLDPLLFTSALANYRLITALGAAPDVLVGHSFGEIAALTCAGIITVRDAARLVCARALSFSATSPRGGMLAISIDARRAAHLAALVDDRLAVAVDNGPDQCVVSGPDEALAELGTAATALGVHGVRLKTAYPFHNPVLRQVADPVAALSHELTMSMPAVPVYSCILGDYITDPDDARRLLGDHLTRPVHFYDGLLRVHRDGVRTFVEAGSRKLLGLLVGKCLPAATRSVTAPDQAGSVEEVRALLHGSAIPAAAVPAPAERPVRAVPAPPVAEPPPPQAALVPASKAELVKELRLHYADLLNLPEELLADDIDLEADLGVDSLKQTESFTQLRRRYELGELPEDLRVTSFTTIPAIADLIANLGAAGATNGARSHS